MDNKINLNFNKTLSSIAGYDLGEKIYEEQVKDLYKIDQKNIIVFPPEIERIAISFIQGFIDGLIKKRGYDKMLNEIEIQGNEKVVKRFNEVI